MDGRMRVEVGVMIERSRAYGRQLCEGVATYALEHRDWNLTPIDGNDLSDGRKMRRFDGFICRFLDTRIPARFQRFGKPIVDVYHDRPLRGIAAVDSDHVEIGRTAAAHFLERHFTRFAFCGHNGCGYSDGRYAGFAATLRTARFECLRYATPANVRYRFDNKTIFSDPKDDEGDSPQLRRWLADLPKPIAVFCSHDFRAYQLMQCCNREGISIPGEVAVLGVDNDSILCSFTTPSLSSVDPNAFGVGYAAAERLAELIAGETDDGKSRFAPCRGVVLRESTDTFPIEPRWLSDALLFIQHNVADGLSASDVCRHVGRSHTLVADHFKRIVGANIQEVISRTRLAEAKRLLRTGEPPVLVAKLSGFKSLSYFSNCFTAAFGYPPSQHLVRP